MFWSVMRKYFPLSVFLFFLSFLFGVLFAAHYPSLAQESFRELQEAFSPLFDLSPVSMALFIFFNNSIKVFVFIFLGILFAAPTLFFLVLNGWVLGYVAGLTYPQLGLQGLFYSLFFHGIFELTALFIGASLGLWLGVSALKGAVKNKEKIKEKLSLALDVFVYLVVPLLAVAAIIETYIIFFL